MLRVIETMFISGLALVAATAPAAAQDSYRLTPVSPGPSMSLNVGVLPGASLIVGMLEATAQPVGQYWQLQPQGGGVFKLTNLYGGPGQCLDVAGDGGTYMAPCGPQIGQRWRIEEVTGLGVALRNDFKPGECLGFVNALGHQVAAMTSCTAAFIPPNQIWVVSLTGR